MNVIIINLLPRKNNTLLAILFIGLFFLGEDSNFNHLIHVDSAKINFRENYNLRRAGHLFYRRDYKTPALYINKNLNNGDKVVSFILGPYFYLSKLDYFFIEKSNNEFYSLQACNGKKELWTDAKMLSKREALFNLINSSEQTLWIISHSMTFSFTTETEEALYEKYRSNVVYTSIDGMIIVYRFNAINKSL